MSSLSCLIRTLQQQISDLDNRTNKLERILDLVTKHPCLAHDLKDYLERENDLQNATAPILLSAHGSTCGAERRDAISAQDSCAGHPRFLHPAAPPDAAASAAAAAATEALAWKAGLSMSSLQARPPAPAGDAAIDADAGATSGRPPNGFRSQEKRHDLERSPDQAPREHRPGPVPLPVEAAGRDEAAGWPVAPSPCKSAWSGRDDLSAYSAASTAVSLPATFKPPPRRPLGTLPVSIVEGLRRGDVMAGDDAADEDAAAAAAAAGLNPPPPQHRDRTSMMRFGFGLGSDRPIGYGADAGGGSDRSGSEAFPELGGEAVLQQVLRAAGSETGIWLDRLADRARSDTVGGGSSSSGCAGGGAGGTGGGRLPDLVAAAAGAATVSSEILNGLDSAVQAALVLMLLCRETEAARAEVAGSPDALRAAGDMLRYGTPLEQRIAAHLMWFASRSREGARALYDTCMAPRLQDISEGGAEAAAAAVLPPLPPQAPGFLGVLVEATGSQDVHTAKAAALSLHNALVGEGGAAAVEEYDACGVVSTLLGMLAASDDVGGEAAAAALAAAAERSEVMRTEMVDDGGVEALVTVLRSGGPSTQISAAGALEHLTLEAEGAARLAACGGVRQVVELLRHGVGEARVRAVGVLRNLADVEDCHHAILRAGVLPLLVSAITAPPSPPPSGTRDHRSSEEGSRLPPQEDKLDGISGEEGAGVAPDGGAAGELMNGRSRDMAAAELYDEYDSDNEDIAGDGDSDEGDEEGDMPADAEDEAWEVRVQAVNSLVNLATRGASDVRRALVSTAAPEVVVSSGNSSGGGGGSSGLWALLSVVAYGGGWWDPETVAWALQGILALSADGQLRAELVRQGGVRVLQQAMLGGAPRQRELAAQALANLTTGASDTAKVAILEAGAAVVLAATLRDGNSGARHAACCALQNLASCPACRGRLLAAGAAEALTAAAVDGDGKIASAAVRALYNISCSIRGCKELVSRGLVRGLLSALQRPSMQDVDPSPFGYGMAASAAGGGGVTPVWNGGGAAGAVERRFQEFLAKVLKRLALYGNDGGIVQREVQQALARASIL